MPVQGLSLQETLVWNCQPSGIASIGLGTNTIRGVLVMIEISNSASGQPREDGMVGAHVLLCMHDVIISQWQQASTIIAG